jgi:hypothetical protein
LVPDNLPPNVWATNLDNKATTTYNNFTDKNGTTRSAASNSQQYARYLVNDLVLNWPEDVVIGDNN